MDAASQPLPIRHRETVQDAWVDYNGHMNVAYYVLVFDHATDGLFDQIGLDAVSRDSMGGSAFVVESHVSYLNEVMAGEAVEVDTRVLDVDDKRMRVFHRMFRADIEQETVATNELLLIYIDMKARRAAAMPADVRGRLDALKAASDQLPPPPEAGRSIAIGRRPK
jgi:acyl-CoA thioester hydrolase